mgnify:CR=1 FL=1
MYLNKRAIQISTFWSGNCPECSLNGKSGRMRLNIDDFFECEKCSLQIVLSAPNILATILNWRGKKKFRQRPEYADERICNEILCRQTMEGYPFTDKNIFQSGREIEEYLLTCDQPKLY